MNILNDNKNNFCIATEKKEKFWKRTSISLIIVIVIFCILVIYGYIIAANYKG